MKMTIPFPIVIAKEGKWFVASCPVLGIATQGRTEKEVKENMKDLIKDYFEDPDTVKPKISMMKSITVSLTSIPVNIIKGVGHRKITTSSKA